MVEGKETDGLRPIVSSGWDEEMSLFERTAKGADSEDCTRERA
jgi:hypothetical protein